MKTPHKEIEEIIKDFNKRFINDPAIPTYIANGGDVEEWLRNTLRAHDEKLLAHTDILKGERRRIIEQLREEVKEELMDEVREGIKAKEKEEDTALYAEFEQRAKVAMENMEKGYFNQGLQTAQEVVEGLLGKK